MVKPAGEKTKPVKRDPSFNHGPKNRVAERSPTSNGSSWPLVTIGIVGAVLVMAFVALAWLNTFTLNKTPRDTEQFGNGQSPFSKEYDSSRENRHDPRGFSRSAISGVVSAVSGDTVTVIGGGKKTIVKLTERTRITSDDESRPVVNDTVVVFGTKNEDDTVTASRIVIRNGDEPDGPTRESPRMRQAVPSA